MNFKLKALVAAVALVGFASQASATINTTIGTQASSGNGSDLIFYVVDHTNTNGFYEDLTSNGSHGTDQTFAYNTTQTWAASSGLSSFLSAAETNGDTVAWGVVSAKFVNGSANGEDVTTTLSKTITDPTSMGLSDSGSLTAIAGSSGKLAKAFNTFTSVAAEQTAGGSVQSGGTNSANPSNMLGNDNFGLNTTGLIADNALGATGVQYIQSIAGTANNPAVEPGTWSLTMDGNLAYTVAAVPEPETYGMLAAGLLMLGAVARRRKA